ncbi:MAG: heme exporter protein C [Cellvibrionaceae bacterium]|jgi:heme exporter protein C
MINFLTKRSGLLNWIALIAMVILMGMIFVYAPTEKTMGHVQRIFYFHVGTAWVASVTFFVALVCGVLYLWKRSPILDTIAMASVEIGVAFVTMTIVSGSVWGKPAWNTWWLWSPRLTSITILWLVYIAYFILRSAIYDDETKRRFSAVYVIAGFVTVILTYSSIRILRDIHPVMFGNALESAQGMEQGLQDFSGLDSIRMVVTLNVAVVAFSLLYVAWLANRIKFEQMRGQLDQIRMRILASE